jgi:hypothetical protein
MKKLLLLSFITLLLTACNKNQRAVKKLDGNWTIDKYVFTFSNGLGIDLVALGAQGTYNISGCVLKDDEYCNYTHDLTVNSPFLDTTITESNQYKVINKGQSIQTLNGNGTLRTINIKELTNSFCELEQTDTTATITIEMSK